MFVTTSVSPMGIAIHLQLRGHWALPGGLHGRVIALKSVTMPHSASGGFPETMAALLNHPVQAIYFDVAHLEVIYSSSPSTLS